MSVAIIDYESGNLHSAAKAFQRAADGLGLRVDVISTPEALRNASHIVLPGVGAYGDCMAGLARIDGMIEAMEEAVLKRGKPFFGICVGMQLMLERGLEHGEHAGLGWIKGEVVPIEPTNDKLKIPHMGWNELEIVAPDHPLFRGIQNGEHVYFVHSYHAQCANPADCLAMVDYGTRISACIGRDNLVGTQFHPEKSQDVGLRLIENFLRQ